MPAAQLVTAAIESAINTLLSLDESSNKALKPLIGKQLKVTIEEAPWPLLFHFSDRIDVLIPEPDQIVDCSIEMSFITLQNLQDSSQITRLIQQQKLRLEGDIHVAQHFSQLMTQLDIDWEQQLANYTGDVFAHNVFRALKQFGGQAKSTYGKFTRIVADSAIEEKRIAAPGLLVAAYCDKVNDLRSDVERLEARLNNIAKNLSSPTQNSVVKD